MDEATSAATGTPQPTTRTQSAAKTDWTGLFGYDMFLSYRREEASGFAAALAQDLARLDFTCFLDRADAPAGMRLEPHIGRALDRSKVLIVVVTKEAPNSPWVTMEVDRFLSVRPRPVIPLDVNGRYLSLVPDATPWGRLRKLNLITAEASSEEIASGQPSPDLARKVEATFQYLKANTRRRIATSVVAGVLIVTTAFAVWKAVQATRSALEAQQQQQSAEKRLYLTQMSLAQQNWEVQNVGSIPGVLKASWPRLGSKDLRGWEWYYIFGLVHTSKATLEQVGGPIVSVSWSPDGQLIAAATSSGMGVWNPVDQSLVRQIPAEGGFDAALAWSTDSQSLAELGTNRALVWERSGGSVRRWEAVGTTWFPGWQDNRFLLALADGTIFKWDTQTGETNVVGKLRKPKLATWSSDGRIAVAFQGRYGTPHHDRDYPPEVWITDSRGHVLASTTLKNDPPEDLEITALAWKSDSNILAIATADKRIELWDVTQKRKEGVSRLTGHQGVIRNLAWSRSGRLASASDDQTVRIWDAAHDAALRTLRGHTGPVRSVCWNAQGTLLASGGADQTVRIWSATTEDGPQPFQVIKDFTPASDQLVPGNLSVKSIQWAPDGQRLVAVGQGFVDDGDVASTVIFRMRGGPVVVDENHEAAVFWRPDGRRFIYPDGAQAASVRDADTGREVLELPGNDGYFWTVAWSRDGKRIATAGDGGTIRIWEDATGREIHALPSEAGRITQLEWTEDGHHLSAQANNAATIEVWDSILGKRIRGLRMPGVNMRSLAWSPSKRFFAVANADGAVEAWDIVEGRQLSHMASSAKSVRIDWSPDSKRLAVFQNKLSAVDVWDPFAGKILRRLSAEPGWSYVGSWSATGAYFVSKSLIDGSMRVWKTLDSGAAPLYSLTSAYRSSERG